MPTRFRSVLVLFVILCAVGSSGCGIIHKRKMAAKAGVVDRFFDAWSRNGGDIGEIVHEDYEFTINQETNKGIGAYRVFMSIYHTAMSDLTFTRSQVLVSGDKVVNYWRAEGTHDGKLGNIPATGKKLATEGITIVQVRDGMAVAEWTMWDEHDFLTQLGVVQ